MILLVDENKDRSDGFEKILNSVVSKFPSWPKFLKFAESFSEDHEPAFVFLSEGIWKSLSNPAEVIPNIHLELKSPGLWVVLSETPEKLFAASLSAVHSAPLEFWTPVSVPAKLEFFSQPVEAGDRPAEPGFAFCARNHLFLSEVGILAEQPISAGVLSFSLEGFGKNEVMFLDEPSSGPSGHFHHWFSSATSGALREVYQRLQKDERREKMSTGSQAGERQMPPLVWVGAGAGDETSLREFFPELSVFTLPHLGLESESADSSPSGDKEFFEIAKAGQLASFKLDLSTLDVLGLWGTDLKGFHTFSGELLSNLTGKSFLDLIVPDSRDRFQEVVRKLSSVRPLINFFELKGAHGRFCEILLDVHREDSEEFLLARINPWPGEIEDHVLQGHEEGLRPTGWPRWVILPAEEWRRVGGTESVRHRLENFYRRPEGAEPVSVWVTQKPPLQLAETQELFSKGVERVWSAPIPFRLLARQIHELLGGPHPSEFLEVSWSSKPQTLFQKIPVQMERKLQEGVVLRSKTPVQRGQILVLDGSPTADSPKGTLWTRVAQCEPAGETWLLKSSFMVQHPSES